MVHKVARLPHWPTLIDIDRFSQLFGTPAWIVCEDQLAQNVRDYVAFTGQASRIFYPVKTNPSLAVLQLLANQGVGADCASQLEINLALFAGIKIQNISYNTPVQDIEICQSLLRAGANVVMDDMEAILDLQARIKNTEIKGKLFVRLNLPDNIGYSSKNPNQDLMAHGHKSSKFGIPTEDLESVLARVTLPISGLHVHVGTQMDNMESFEYAMISLNKLAAALNQSGHAVTDINLGGGLGIPFDEKQSFPALDYWCYRMNQLKSEHYQYSVEPGHALVGNAVALLTSVQTVKSSRGKKWVIVDVGTDQLTKVTLLKWPHRILYKQGEEVPDGNDAIAGPLCFAGDTLKDNIQSFGIEKGTPLLVTEAGAYTFSLANKFNGRTAPKWLRLTAHGELIQTMAKESVHDEAQLVKHEWITSGSDSLSDVIDLSLVENLSSEYLSGTFRGDVFNYIKVSNAGDLRYEFTVQTHSEVDFISMPFAMRIFGDAAIIAILHSKGFSKKNFAMWGRKFSMDCYGQVPSNVQLDFTITLSATVNKGNQNIMVARFASSCNQCSGSILTSFGS